MTDRVHIVTQFWDSPREGIADFRGRLHYFENEFDRQTDDYSEWFILAPVSDATLQVAVELDEILKSWVSAFKAEQTTYDTHPVLPPERHRFDELKKAFAQKLQDARMQSFRVRGSVTCVKPPNWSPIIQGPTSKDYVVSWINDDLSNS